MTPASFKSKLRAGLLVVVIASMSGALYLSPAGKDLRAQVRRAVPFVADAKESPSSAPKHLAPKVDASTVYQPATSSTGVSEAIGVSHTLTPVASEPDATKPTTPATPAPTTSAPIAPSVRKIEGCWSFTYQQDAQAVYAADLSDPYGLDGPKGGSNGDGLACTQLPVDSSRPASVPVGAFKRAIATKSQVMASAETKKLFGVAEDGLPGDTGLMDDLALQVGKAPSTVEWFSTWDEDYAASKVEKSWDRGALPVITWMPAHKGNKNPADTSLQRIVDGDWDDYITKYAKEVAADGEPVVMRFAHESNGNWYPWSAGGNRAFERGATDVPFVNTPELYRAAWKRVWNIFEDNGANKDTIWAWAPVRVDDINPNTTDKTKASYGLTALKDSYPGDAYVDWVGLSAYSYKGSSWSYDTTFKKTFDQLGAVAPTKPIFVAETGASENSGTQSNAELKPAWITDTLTSLAANTNVVGFVWFNNTVVDVHTIDGIKITTDNKWDSSTASLQAFVDQIADPVWLSGTGSDPIDPPEISAPATTP